MKLDGDAFAGAAPLAVTRAALQLPIQNSGSPMQVLRFLLLCLACALLVAPDRAAAKPKLYRGEYSLSFLGLPVARATFDSRIDAKSYSVEGSVASAGLARILDDTRGTVSASGTFAGEVARPQHFRADYVSGKKKGVVDIRFKGGSVAKVTTVPPPRKRRNWVPLGPGDLRAVADPMAALLIKAGGPEAVCGRTVRLFDGELRADLKLSFVSADEGSGSEAPTVTCRLGFIPVSGYRKDKRALEFLRNRSRMTVVFAELDGTGIYAPVHATIGTEIGTITMRARRVATSD
jgi:hypothetical protein